MSSPAHPDPCLPIYLNISYLVPGCLSVKLATKIAIFSGRIFLLPAPSDASLSHSLSLYISMLHAYLSTPLSKIICFSVFMWRSRECSNFSLCSLLEQLSHYPLLFLSSHIYLSINRSVYLISFLFFIRRFLCYFLVYCFIRRFLCYFLLYFLSDDSCVIS